MALKASSNFWCSHQAHERKLFGHLSSTELCNHFILPPIYLQPLDELGERPIFEPSRIFLWMFGNSHSKGTSVHPGNFFCLTWLLIFLFPFWIFLQIFLRLVRWKGCRHYGWIGRERLLAHSRGQGNGKRQMVFRHLWSDWATAVPILFFCSHRDIQRRKK